MDELLFLKLEWAGSSNSKELAAVGGCKHVSSKAHQLELTHTSTLLRCKGVAFSRTGSHRASGFLV
jgi:hypothetical protein